mgnify:CR=1 FL=1
MDRQHTEHQNAVIKEVMHYVLLAERHFQQVFTLDSVQFNLRGRAAGQFKAKPKKDANKLFLGASMYETHLRFNNALLEQYGAKFISDTVAHEVAHFVVYEVFSKPAHRSNRDGRRGARNGKQIKPHGIEWRSVMVDVFDADPSVTHDYIVEPAYKKSQYPFICECPDRVHQLGPVRFKRVIENRAKYVCKTCRQELQPVAASTKKS